MSLPSWHYGFPCGSNGKESACNAGDSGKTIGMENRTVAARDWGRRLVNNKWIAQEDFCMMRLTPQCGTRVVDTWFYAFVKTHRILQNKE